MDSRGYYATLGVSQDANFQEIKKSYRKLARKYHPDRSKSPLAEETIKKINEAFEILSDRKKEKNTIQIPMIILNQMKPVMK
jgi:DnaJ-class molecular chaperone with C-terminal Zn finger domain